VGKVNAVSFDTMPLKVIRGQGVDLSIIVNVGADIGGWALAARSVYPNAHLILIEPRRECLPALQTIPNATVHTALVGDSERAAVEFNVHGLQSSVHRNTAGARFGGMATVPMTTLDALVDRCDYLQVDTQGAELLVLSGATRLLSQRPIVQLELNLHRFYDGCPLAHEVIEVMAARGYLLWDLIDPLRRTLDMALGNIDAVFVPEEHPLHANRKWGWGSWS
jgi:FkbM family methyltransferase